MAIDSDEEMVELRGLCPRIVIDVLDAVSQSKRISRVEQMNRVLAVWARDVVRQATVVQNVTKGNPRLLEPKWNDTEI